MVGLSFFIRLDTGDTCNSLPIVNWYWNFHGTTQSPSNAKNKALVMAPKPLCLNGKKKQGIAVRSHRRTIHCRVNKSPNFHTRTTHFPVPLYYQTRKNILRLPSRTDTDSIPHCTYTTYVLTISAKFCQIWHTSVAALILEKGRNFPVKWGIIWHAPTAMFLRVLVLIFVLF